MTAIFAIKHAVILISVYAFFASAVVQEVTSIQHLNDVNGTSCGENRFACRNGDCIPRESLCDGRADCSDQSDETALACGSLSILGIHTTTIKSAIRLKRRAQAASSSLRGSFCLVPPQPPNGQWRLHRSLCDADRDCYIPQGLRVDPGSQLVYTCNPNYKTRGTTDVFCLTSGIWTAIPMCVETKCSTLNTLSTIASCYLSQQSVDCSSAVSPGTRAKLSCRPGYRQATTSYTTRRSSVTCSVSGKWEPDPITCIPVCGVGITQQTPLVANGVTATIGDFPWQASLYKQENTVQGSKKLFQCGATIIQANLVMTAAHCIYDDFQKTALNPDKLFVLTGNTFRDYDSRLHNPKIVRKAEVKNVYMHCQYFGEAGNFASDIALLELKQPFELSSILQPACMDFAGYSEQILEPGVSGKISGFGMTELGDASAILQTLTVPYVSYSKCKSQTTAESEKLLISNDKFCAGYVNGSALCEGDSGGGLVFKINDLWTVMGIASVGLGGDRSSGVRTCDEHTYSLYTKVSTHIAWIQDVIFQLERFKSYSSCGSQSETSSVRPAMPPTTTTTTTTTNMIDSRLPSIEAASSCKVPPQPAHGSWKLHPYLCEGDTHCSVPQGSALGPGDQLVYSCMPGFRINGSPDVYCRRGGRWSSIPTCVEITCHSLDSASMIVDCYRSNDRIPCNSTVLPNTRAVLTCRRAYKEDASLLRSGSRTVTCNMNGEWKPRPITCLPVCGITNTRLTPTILDGTAADVLEFPWHATLYKEDKPSEGPKVFQCGATIVQNRILLTAAHCVYNEIYLKVEKPERFHVVTGNKFRDYDSPYHDPRIVRKATVKSIHVPCEYSGLDGNYGSDIAIIELEKPFRLSDILIPACMDVLGNNLQLLESGSVGRFAGFGRTRTGTSSATLLTTNVPYVSYRKCKMANGTKENVGLIAYDKFCGGGQTGTGVCQGDSGGGLVFENNGRWHLMGILSVNLGADKSNGEKTCDANAYSLYTKVSSHMQWIQEVIYSLQLYQSYQSCGSSSYK